MDNLFRISKRENKNFKRKKGQIQGSALHKVLYRLGDLAVPPLKSITKPTVYVSELESNLRLLEREHLVSEIMILHDELLPRYYYSLTKYGEVEVEKLIEKLKICKSAVIEAIVSNTQK